MDLVKGKSLLKNRIMSAFIAIALISTFTGCSVMEEVPELLEPASSPEVFSMVTRQDVYELEHYNTTVIPGMTELGFSEKGQLGQINVRIGQEVKAGEVLASLKGDSKEYERLNNELFMLRKENEYSDLQREIEIEIGKTNNYDMSRNILVDTQQKKLQAIEENYLLKKISYEKKKISGNEITAPYDGVVVALQEGIHSGDYVESEVPVVVVADTNKQLVWCNHLMDSQILGCDEISLSLGGKSYELEYIPYDQGTIDKFRHLGEDIYTCFEIKDGDSSILGKSGVILLKKRLRKNVLTVPNNALKREGEEGYVYLVVNGEKKYTSVKAGVKGEMYTEILEGLNEGDIVYVPEITPVTDKERVLALEDFESVLKMHGSPFYPYKSELWYKTEYSYGEFIEYKANNGQTVNEGDVILTLENKISDADIRETELKIQRAKEDINDIERLRGEELWNAEYDLNKYYSWKADSLVHITELRIKSINLDYDMRVLRVNNDIKELEKQLREMKKARDTKEILAPMTGIIEGMQRMTKGDAINNDTYIGAINEQSFVLYTVKNDTGAFNYGMQVKIIDEGGKEYNGKVVSTSAPVLTSKVTSPYAYIAITDENITNYPTRIEIEYALISYENVIVLTEDEYTIDEKGYYVVEKTDEGNRRFYFTPGAKISGDVMSVDGLKEGMTIVVQ